MNKDDKELREYLKNRREKCDFISQQIVEQYKHLVRKLRILEVGSSAGAMVAWLTTEQRLAPYIEHITGLELLPELVEYSNRRFPKLKKDTFVAGNIFDPPFPTESFDVIFCVDNVLGELRTKKYSDANAIFALKEMHELLKRDGIVILEVSNSRYMNQHARCYHRREKEVFFTSEGYSRWFSKAMVEALLKHTHFDPLGPPVPCPNSQDSEELRKLNSNWLIAARKV